MTQNRMGQPTQRGFTLLEVLIVIVILGILAGLAVPRFIKASDSAREAEALIHISAIKGSVYRYLAAQVGSWVIDDSVIAELDIDNPNDNTLYPSRLYEYSFMVERDITGAIMGTITATPLESTGLSTSVLLNMETGEIVRF